MKRSRLKPEDYIQGILAQDRFILSRAITLIESNLAVDNELGRSLIEKLIPYTARSLRIGITGVPGVGKSTFIESFGQLITSQGHKLAVLAIDPSSQRSGGSIMGDKTRMESLSLDPMAYIRPSPAGSSLGGVSRKTREAMLLCEAAGYEVIIVETVGVGQSETAVSSMTDFFLLLMLAGAGDELQGIKKGIMEMADLVAITKTDGANEQNGKNARLEYQRALHFFPAAESGWTPKALCCSAVSRMGLAEIWAQIQAYQRFTMLNSYFQKRRIEQNKMWFYDTIRQELENRFFSLPSIQSLLPLKEKAVTENREHPVSAALELIKSLS
jgi:LAO/AO transport system kinase